MKLVSYVDSGRGTYGVVSGNGVVDLGKRLGSKYPTLRDALVADALSEIEPHAAGAPDRRLDEIAFEPVIPRPQRIICVGVNYREHQEESGRENTGFPSIFLRLPSTVVGHGQPILRPLVSTMLDYEGELAVVIGKAGRSIPHESAYAHVAGYSCFNDASVRDWQRHNPSPIPGKNFDRCGAFGPWLVTRDEIPDGDVLTLTTSVNGQEVQRATTDLLIYDIPAIIAYASTFTLLEPGDVIATGTPGGVGSRRVPPLWLKPGDTVEVTLSGIGTLANVIEEDPGV